MSFAAEFGTGQVLWSILWFFLFIMWFWLVIMVFADIIRAHDMSGWAKAFWTIGIIFLPFLGVFLYLIINGSSMNRRSDEQMEAANDAAQAYIRDVAGSGGSVSDQLEKLASLHDSGSLTDAEYDQAKSKLMSS